MHIKDSITTKQNITLRATWRYREAITNEFNCIEQIYIRFQAPFGLKYTLVSGQIIYF